MFIVFYLYCMLGQLSSVKLWNLHSTFYYSPIIAELNVFCSVLFHFVLNYNKIKCCLLVALRVRRKSLLLTHSQPCTVKNAFPVKRVVKLGAKSREKTCVQYYHLTNAKYVKATSPSEKSTA